MGRRPCRAPEWGWGPRAPLSSVSGRPGRRLLAAGPSCSPRPRGRGPQPRRRARACPAGGTTCRAGKRRRHHRSHLCITRTGREARDAAQRHWARTRQTRPGVRSSALIIRVEADDGPLPRLPRGPRRRRVWTGTGLPPGGPVPPRQDRAPWRPRRGGGRKRPSRGHGLCRRTAGSFSDKRSRRSREPRTFTLYEHRLEGPDTVQQITSVTQGKDRVSWPRGFIPGTT